MELLDLTKDEIIKLLRQHFHQPTEYEMLKVRWESLTTKAKEVLDEAQIESDKWVGVKSMEGVKRFCDASKIFDRGIALYDEADRVNEKMKATRVV